MVLGLSEGCLSSKSRIGREGTALLGMKRVNAVRDCYAIVVWC